MSETNDPTNKIEDIWNGTYCKLCKVLCNTSTEKMTHEVTIGHQKKKKLYDFYMQSDIYNDQPVQASKIFEKFYSDRKRLIGLECIHEIHTMTQTSEIWSCSLCLVSEGSYDSVEAHLLTEEHIRSYLDECHSELLDEDKKAGEKNEHKGDEVCTGRKREAHEEYDWLIQLAERAYKICGLQQPVVLRVKMFAAEALKKFDCVQPDDGFTTQVCPTDAKKSVLFCKSCHEVIPVYASSKFTMERAKKVHKMNARHKTLHLLNGRLSSFVTSDDPMVQPIPERFEWSEHYRDGKLLNMMCGLEYAILTDREIFCSLCNCSVLGSINEHFASEMHVVAFCNSLVPYDAYLCNQLPEDYRIETVIEILNKQTNYRNSYLRKTSLREFPDALANCMGEMNSQYDVLPTLYLANDGKRHFRCNICLQMKPINRSESDEGGDICREWIKHGGKNYREWIELGEDTHREWIKHLHEDKHFELSARQACFFTDRNFPYIVPYPQFTKQVATVDKGQWIVKEDTWIQNQCDVGLECMVENDDEDEVYCSCCSMIFSRKSTDTINNHIRSVEHAKQYIYYTGCFFVELLLSQKTPAAQQEVILQFLQQFSVEFPKSMRVFSVKKTIELNNLSQVKKRTIESALHSDKESREVYDCLMGCVDIVSSGEEEQKADDAREALVGFGIVIIKTQRNANKKLESMLCKCNRCERVFLVNAATWIDDVFEKHLKSDEHYRRYDLMTFNRFDALGICAEKSTYTVRPFEQKDLKKKVSWQWNKAASSHEYVLGIIGLEDIVERRKRSEPTGDEMEQTVQADFYCTVCCVDFQKRALSLEAHVRSFSHCFNYLNRHKAEKLEDLLKEIAKSSTNDKTVRLMMSALLKEVMPQPAYCIKVYDPEGEEERRCIEIQNKAKEQERLEKVEKAKKDAAEERRKIQAQNAIRREEQVRKMNIEHEKRRQREEEQKLVIQKVAEAKKEQQAQQEKAQQEKAHQFTSAGIAELRQQLAQKKKQYTSDPKQYTSDPKLVIPHTRGAKTLPADIAPIGATPPYMGHVVGHMPHPMHMQQMTGPMMGVSPPTMVSHPNIVQPSQNFYHQQPANFYNHVVTPPNMNEQVYFGRPSLIGKRVNMELTNKMIVKTRADLILKLRQGGIERIPEKEKPTQFSQELSDIPEVLGLEEINEVVCIDCPELDSYLCSTCEEWLAPRGVKSHLRSQTHQMTILFKHHKDHHNVVKNEKNGDLRKSILNNFCSILHKAHHLNQQIIYRAKLLLRKDIIERLWPGYEDHFFNEKKTSEFVEEYIPMSAALSKQALAELNDDDDDLEVVKTITSEKNRRRSRSPRHHRDSRRRSRSRRRSSSRSRSRGRSRNRGRSRSGDRGRRRDTRSRSRSSSNRRVRHRSRSRSRSAIKNTGVPVLDSHNAFLSKLSSKPAEKEDRYTSKFEDNMALVRNLAKMGTIQGSSLASVDPKKVSGSPMYQDGSSGVKRTSRDVEEEELRKKRKMLGVMIAVQQGGTNITEKIIQDTYTDFGLKYDKSDPALNSMLDELQANKYPPPQKKLDLAHFGLAGLAELNAHTSTTSYGLHGGQQPSSYAKAFNPSNGSPSTQMYGKPSSNMPRFSQAPQSAQSTDKYTNRMNSADSPITLDDDDEDDDYQEVLAVIQKANKKKDEEPKNAEIERVVPTQRMNLGRTKLPNGMWEEPKKTPAEKPSPMATVGMQAPHLVNPVIGPPGVDPMQIHQQYQSQNQMSQMQMYQMQQPYQHPGVPGYAPPPHPMYHQPPPQDPRYYQQQQQLPQQYGLQPPQAQYGLPPQPSQFYYK